MYYEDKMIDRSRDKESGKFVQKSEQKRKVRSIRLTDKTYDYLREKAEENNQTIADLIEQIVADRLLENNQNNSDLINQSKELLYDEELVRSRDRSPVKKLLSKLFGIDKDFYDKSK